MFLRCGLLHGLNLSSAALLLRLSRSTHRSTFAEHAASSTWQAVLAPLQVVLVMVVSVSNSVFGFLLARSPGRKQRPQPRRRWRSPSMGSFGFSGGALGIS